ncbi:Zinc finger protein [Plakobranchus ocellatus]|uniref:Zinc finger protein n=1 Tax=Plakobranchus ocellatus TaxID=259542 RepID=A0AAV4CQK9_9GAST|nr:Zinc finger protein [Plakobranchus ocellatus]
MDACSEDLTTSLREKDLPTLERVPKEADLFLKARTRKLCDQLRKVFQGNVRPRMDSVRPLELEKTLNGGQRAWEAKTSVADHRSCFKCKKTGHIARYCTAVDSTTKKTGAGVVVKTTEVNTAEARKPAEGPTMEVTDDLQSEVEDGMLKLASGKSVSVMTNCAALRDPEMTRSLGLPVLKGEIGGREVGVMRDTGCEGVVVRKQLVDASQLTGECCLLLRIDNTALLAEKAPFLSGEVKALCIPDAICDVIVRTWKELGARKTPTCGATQAAAGICDVGSPRFYYWSASWDQENERQGLEQLLLACGRWRRDDVLPVVCQRTVKKGTVPRVPLEKVPLIDTPFKRVAIDLIGPINPPSEAGHRFILTLVDYATRFAEAVPLHKIDRESVVDIYSRLGVPEEVLSGRERSSYQIA